MDITTGSTYLLKEGNYANVVKQGNYLYCLDLDNNYSIIRMNLDGSNIETLVNERCLTFNVDEYGSYLVYQRSEERRVGKEC